MGAYAGRVDSRQRGRPLTVPDCRTCGGCCLIDLHEPTYFPLMAGDRARLPKRLHLHIVDDQLTTITTRAKRGPLAGKKITRCVMLKGTVGHAVSCSVYEDRPTVCREAIEPGDAACILTRRTLFGHD